MNTELAFIAFLTVSTGCLAQISRSTSDIDSYTVCQTYSGRFDNSNVQTAVKVKAGKAGPKGDKGEKGESGSNADVEKLTNIQNTVKNLQIIKDCKGILWGGVCYFMLGDDRVTYTTAIANCNSHDAEMVIVDNQQLYGAIWRLVFDTKLNFDSRTQVQIWMDGTLEGGNVVLSDGRQAPFLLWYPGYPNSRAGHIQMAFEVKKGGGSQHMFNIVGAHRAFTVCQRKLV